MSNPAITWALGQNVGRSSAKFVLVAMANLADETTMTCFPSIKYLSDATCQDRKTVLENIKRLKDAGYISDTGERKGATGQVIVYQLNSTENGSVIKSVKTAKTATNSVVDDADLPNNSTENGTGTENGTVPKTEGNSPVFPAKEARFSVVTVPKTGHGHHMDTSIDTKGIPKKSAQSANGFDPMDYLTSSGVESQAAKDWLRHRKTKKADASKTAIDGHIREAGKAGISLQDALVMACERGWAGFKAEWVVPKIGQQARASPPRQPVSQVDLDEINRQAKELVFGRRGG